MGPKKFFKSKLIEADEGNDMKNLANFCLIVDKNELEFKSFRGSKIKDLGTPFFAFDCEFT